MTVTIVAAIAGCTLREALRNRLLLLLGAAVLAAIAGGAVLQGMALTEGAALQAALLAAALRLAAAFIVAAFVVTSMAREADDKGRELLLAMAMPRAAYLFGKLAGFGALALLPALVFGVLLARYAAPAQAALWSAGLLCELWIVAAFAVLCMLTLRQPLSALAACAGFYVLARSAAALQLIAQAPAAQHNDRRWLAAIVDGVTWLLPRFDRYASSEWLLYGAGSWTSLADIATQTAIYVALLAGAALVDLYRKGH